MAYHRYHGVDTKIVRIFNTFGPRMRKDDGRAVPTFINQALAGEADHRLRRRSARPARFGYVTDLVEGHLRAHALRRERAGQHRQPRRR